MRPYSKLLIIAGLTLLATVLRTPETWADACDCKVTSLSGSANFQTSECTLNKELFAGCTAITIDASVLTGGKAQTISLPMGISVIGVSIEGPALPGTSIPGVTLVAANIAETALVQLKDNSTLKMLAVSAPGKTGVQLAGSQNILDTVAVSGSTVGVQDQGTSSTITKGDFENNAIGLQLDGSNGSVTNSIISGNSDTGAKISGKKYTLSGNQLAGNKVDGIQLTPAATGDVFDQNTFSGNTVAIDMAGGNSNMPQPLFIRAFHPKGDTSHVTLVAIAVGGGTVTAYLADSATSPQGAQLAGSKSTLIPSSGFGFWLGDFYTIDMSSVPLNTDIVLITTQQDLGSSAFSTKFTLSSMMDVASDNCIAVHWFQDTMSKLHSSGSSQSVWAFDDDGDKFSNGQEDTNHDCKVDSGETDPSDKSSFPATKPPAVDCKVTPNDPSCPPVVNEPGDGDGISDSKDNCPTVANADQKDYDGDGIGDVCDPDADNDGLTNQYYVPKTGDLYCDPEGKSAPQCALAGIDQEGAVNAVKDPNKNAVKLDPLNADSDGDGYCDGPGFGPIANGKPTVCIKGPGDNCPRISNSTQWDADEDGIGNDCDLSPYNAQTANVDSDGDGVPDYQANGGGDNCPWIANPVDPATGKQKDTDGDGVGDACDSDDDNDGVLDVVENSTRYAIVSKDGSGNMVTTYVMMNPLSAESDTDSNGQNDKSPDSVDQCPMIYGITDLILCGTNPDKHVLNPNDIDGDGIPNDQDSCPTLKNMGMNGASGKDIACDPDIDGDGVLNSAEDAQHTHFWEADSDHYKDAPKGTNLAYTYDGYCDGSGANPFDPMTQQKATCLPSVADVCPANYSAKNADTCHANAGAADYDKDGVPDLKDNCPKIANPDQADMNKNGIGDACDPDIDGDGLLNGKDGGPDKCDKVYSPNNSCPVIDLGPGGGGGSGGGDGGNGGGGGSNITGGGHSCTLTPGAAGTPIELVLAFMALIPLCAFRLRRVS